MCKEFLVDGLREKLEEFSKKIEAFEFDGMIRLIDEINQLSYSEVQRKIAEYLLVSYSEVQRKIAEYLLAGLDDEKEDSFSAYMMFSTITITTREGNDENISTNVSFDSRIIEDIIADIKENGVSGQNFPGILSAVLAEYKLTKEDDFEQYSTRLVLCDDDDDYHFALLIDACIMLDLLLDFFDEDIRPGERYQRHYGFMINEVIAEDVYHEISADKTFKQLLKEA